MWALLGTALFTVIGIVAAVTNQSNAWIARVSLAAACLCFLLAAYLAWCDEHKARLDVEARLPSVLPDFKMQVPEATFMVYDSDQDATFVLLLIELMNVGADSPAILWAGHASGPAGEEDFRFQPVPDSELSLGMPDGDRRFPRDKFIEVQVMRTVPRGHRVGGYAWLRLKGNQASPDLRLVIHCADYRFRTYTAEFPAARSAAT